MAQLLKGIFRISLLLLLAWPSYSSAKSQTTAVTLEQVQKQLQSLTENYVRFNVFKFKIFSNREIR